MTVQDQDLFFANVDPRIARAFELMKERLVHELEHANWKNHQTMQDFMEWQHEVAMQFRLMQRFREALAAAMSEAENADDARRAAFQARRVQRTPQTAGGSSRV